jgi:hypothetical protein
MQKGHPTMPTTTVPSALPYSTKPLPRLEIENFDRWYQDRRCNSDMLPDMIFGLMNDMHEPRISLGIVP